MYEYSSAVVILARGGDSAGAAAAQNASFGGEIEMLFEWIKCPSGGGVGR